MTYKELRKELLKKLDITPQALFERCKKIQSKMPMSTSDATCVVAQRNGIRLNKYLDDNTIHRIRGLLTQVNTPT
jgi:hypothetical protein